MLYSMMNKHTQAYTDTQTDTHTDTHTDRQTLSTDHVVWYDAARKISDVLMSCVDDFCQFLAIKQFLLHPDGNVLHKYWMFNHVVANNLCYHRTPDTHTHTHTHTHTNIQVIIKMRFDDDDNVQWFNVNLKADQKSACPSTQCQS